MISILIIRDCFPENLNKGNIDTIRIKNNAMAKKNLIFKEITSVESI